MRILFVANDPPGATVYRFRCKYPADLLREAGCHVDVAYIGDPRIRVDHDVVVLHRICAVPEGLACARAARACGATLVYGTDDLVYDAGEFPDPLDARKRRFAPLHEAMARQSDALFVSTDYLADHARAFFGDEKPILVGRNFMAPELLALASALRAAPPAREANAVTLGYISGTPTHDADLATVAAPLAATLRENPQTRLLFVGPIAPPALVAEAAGNRLRRVPLVPWHEVPGLVAQVDVNLAPLDLARPFNHAKSEIKFLEAALLGVPTIASASAGFREGQAPDPSAGLLAESPDDWRRLLDRLVNDADARADAGARAYDFVHRCGIGDTHRTHFREVFDTFAALDRPQPAKRVASVVGRSPFAPKTLARRALRLLKRSS